MRDPSKPTDVLGECDVRLLNDLPEYARVLTAPEGELPVHDDAQERVAIVTLPDSPHEVMLLHLPTGPGMRQAQLLRMEATRTGYTIAQELTVAPSVLRQIYEHHAHTRGQDDATDRLFAAILEEALAGDSSDIHISIQKTHASVRFRQGQALVDSGIELEAKQADELKRTLWERCDESSKSELLHEHGFEDASLLTTCQGRDYKVRYSYLPTAKGSKLTLRLLPVGRGERIPTLEQLGYEPEAVNVLRELLTRGSGSVLFTGPTNSGKSTSLVSAIYHEIHQRDRDKTIYTIEDPVEYEIPGVEQISLPAKRANLPDVKTLTFGTAIKALLRADPDVIMVGELRDNETAREAVTAALSGHLMLTTTHAKTPESTLFRLERLGIDPHILASSDFLAGIVSQTLLPKLCPECALTIDAFEASGAGTADLWLRIQRYLGDQRERLRFRSTRGCAHCRERGIKGMVLAYEIFRPDEEMRTYMATGDHRDAYRLWRTMRTASTPSIAGRTQLECALALAVRGLVDVHHIESRLRNLADIGLPRIAS